MNKVIEATQDYWQRFLEYLPLFILGFIVLVFAVFIAGWVAGILRRNLNKRMDDPLLVRFYRE